MSDPADLAMHFNLCAMTCPEIEKLTPNALRTL